MLKNMKQVLVASAVLAMCTGVAHAADDKLDPKKPVQPAVEDKAVMGKAKDAKVSGSTPKNGTVAEAGKRAGPYSCDIRIDNRTNYTIHRIYIDGRNWGTVGRYGDSIARDVQAGGTRVYAEADFTDGTTRSWGPRVFQCSAYGTYTWHLD
jgi:hypothetical protein